MGATLATGYLLAWPWWEVRVSGPGDGPVPYSPPVSAAHNIMSMLVLTFVGAHVAAVLLRRARSGFKATVSTP